MAKRFSVIISPAFAEATKSPIYEEVVAGFVRVHESGALMFGEYGFPGDGEILEKVSIVYAPGTWLHYTVQD